MGLIQYFLMDQTRSVHCHYMHKPHPGLWGRYNFFLWTGLDLYIANICTSHMLRYGADPIFFNVPNSVCALSIYAQVVCRAMGPIEYFLTDRTRSVHCQYMHKSYAALWGRYNFFFWTGLDLYIVNICTSHMPHYGADPIFFNVPNSVCALSIYAQVVCRAMGLIQNY
jgi:hypothetical protein